MMSEVSMSPPQSLSGDVRRTLLRGLLDDAALFPPANLPMPAAVAAHVRHQNAWYSELTGPFVCPETKIGELGRAMTSGGLPWIDLCLVVTGGAQAVPAAIDAIAADARLRLHAVEVPAATGEEPARAIADVAAALDNVPLAGATGFVEYPLTAIADPATAGPLLDIADQHGYRPKLRTGGVRPEAFPAEETLAGCLAGIVGRRMRFKCTAGLHHAVRCTDTDAGLEQHGFLNVMLAVGAAAADAGLGEIAAILGQRDRDAIASAVRALDDDTAADIRWMFTSFGTCSTSEPITEMISLGLLSQH
jgi:hypothetical protein